jgi:GMP synthase (glutamine-hydrolysing)
MLRNFLYGISGAHGLYKMSDRKQLAIQYIKETVKDDKVLVLCSGGVDSTICAALVSSVLRPDQVYVLHIDTGINVVHHPISGSTLYKVS